MLSNFLTFGQHDDALSANWTNEVLDGVTCQDIEELLNDCNSLKPEIFAGYIKIMNYMHEMELDC